MPNRLSERLKKNVEKTKSDLPSPSRALSPEKTFQNSWTLLFQYQSCHIGFRERPSPTRMQKIKRQGRLPDPGGRLPHHLQDTGQRPLGRCGRSETQKGYLLKKPRHGLLGLSSSYNQTNSNSLWYRLSMLLSKIWQGLSIVLLPPYQTDHLSFSSSLLK